MIGIQEIPSAFYSRFYQTRSRQNRQGLFIATFIVLFAGVVFSIQHHLAPGVDSTSFSFTYYRFVYFYCLLVGFLILFFLLFSKGLSPSSRRIGHNIGFFLCINSGVALAIGDITFTSDLSVYIWTLLLFDILQREKWQLIFLQFFYVFFAVIAGTWILQNTNLIVTYVQLFVYTVLSLVVWVGLERIRRTNLVYEFELENKIVEKEKAENELKQAQNQLIESAYKAGMAEVAGDTLHNIGNVINSIHVSSDSVKTVIRENPGESYLKACQLLRENIDNIPGFFSSDPKGKQLIDYLLLLEKPIVTSFEQIDESIERIRDRAAAIGNIISRQSKFINSPFFLEKQNMCQIIDSVIQLVPDLHTDADIKIEKKYENVPNISLQKPTIIRILLNIFDNSVHALRNSQKLEKILRISVIKDKRFVTTSIFDNGYGIAAENLEKVYSSGFTTKEDGFGLDLHNAASILNEMGGALQITSEGINNGTTVSVALPIE